jgi:hypothetical protein
LTPFGRGDSLSAQLRGFAIDNRREPSFGREPEGARTMTPQHQASSGADNSFNGHGEEIEPGLGHALSFFWLFLWRGIVGAAILGLGIGVTTGLLGAFADLSQQAALLLNVVIGLPLGLVWSIFVVRMGFRKRYRGFRIVLVAP